MENTNDILIKEIKDDLATKTAAVKGELAKEIETIASKAATIEDAVKGLGAKIDGMNVQQKDAKIKTFNIVDVIKESIPEIKALNGSGMFNLTQKAVETMSRGTSVTGVTDAIIVPDIDPLRIDYPKPIFSLLMSTNVVPTNSPTIYWSEKVKKDGGAAMTGEGTTKSQSDFKYVGRSQTVKKVTVFTSTTTEVLRDVNGINSDINQELLYEIDLEINKQLMIGDNLGQNLVGITTVANDLNDAGLALQVKNPQRYDCLVAAITQVINNYYVPNEVRVHPTDAALMQLTKDGEDNYIMAPFIGSNGASVSGIRIVADPTMTVGYFLVGDFKKFNVRPLGVTEVAIGYIGNDFIENKLTIRAEYNLCSYVKEHHKKAFVYDSFEDAIRFLKYVEPEE